MSQENVEIVRRLYEALAQRDWDRVFAEARPDFEMTNQVGLDVGTRAGPTAVKAFIEDQIEVFDSWSIEPQEFFESRDQVAVVVTIRARPRGGNVDVVIRTGHVWAIWDGAIVSMKSFPEPEKALEAVGSTE